MSTEGIQSRNEMKPRNLMTAPKAFTRVAIKEYLEEQGASGIIDKYALALLLGTMSQRAVRNHTNAGNLKPINPGNPPFVYTLDAVVDFLMANPRYIAQQRAFWEITEHTAELIRVIVNTDWKTLLHYDDMDGLVSEVQYRMMKTPKTPCSEDRVIRGILGKIWREYKRQGLNINVSLDAINDGKAARIWSGIDATGCGWFAWFTNPCRRNRWSVMSPAVTCWIIQSWIFGTNWQLPCEN